MEENNEKPNKKGFTVSELEGTAKKYASEIGLGVIFAVTAIFTLIWGGAMMVWSILLCMILAIIASLVPGSMMDGISKALDFIYKDKVMLVVTGVVLLIIAIFIPVLIFALIGLISGGSLSLTMKKRGCKTCHHHPKDHKDHEDKNS
ncbi:hypothetical protein K0U07_00235 [bacterium]|nr:hypothetical protein [bacterium]